MKELEIKKPLISVVVTCYNTGVFIIPAVESVYSQTSSTLPQDAFEVTLIDDCSNDATTLSALRDLQLSHPQLRVVVKPNNEGVSAARNTGIKLAEGSWIAFLDGDDLWLPGHLSMMARTIEAYPEANWLSCDYSRIHQDGTEFGMPHIRNAGISQTLDRQKLGEISPVIISRPVEFALTSFLCHVNSTVVKRNLLENVGGFDPSLRSAEDHDLWIRLASVTDLHYLMYRGSLYRVNPTSITNTAKIPHQQLGLVYKKALRTIGSSSHKQLILNRIENIAMTNIFFYRRRKELGWPHERPGSCF